MRAETNVLFDRDELRTIAAAARSTSIAFPDQAALVMDDKARTAYRQRTGIDPLALRSLTDEHGPVTWQRIDAALQTAWIVYGQVCTEAERDYWTRQIRPAEELHAAVKAPFRVPLIADPYQMAGVLVEARQVQRREVHEAIVLLTQARGVASPPARHWKVA